MYKDSIIEELWRVKDGLAAQYGYDIRRMARALRREEKKCGRRLVAYAPRRCAVPASK